MTVGRMSVASAALGLLVGAGLAMAADGASAAGSEAPAAPSSPESYAPWGVDLAGADRSVRPGDDFFRFVNGGWLDRTPIPPDRPLVGIDGQIEERAQEVVRAILDGDAPGPDLATARALYRAFLDTDRADALGAEPVAAILATIRKAADLPDLAALMGRAAGGFGGSLFDLAIRPDPAVPERYAVTVRQGGLGLPDRAYYRDPSFAAARDAYRTYLGRILALAGWREADEAATAVLAFETAVAEASWPARDAHDAARTYNPRAAADLGSAFPWRAFLAAAGLGDVPTVIVAQPEAVAAIAELAGRAPAETLRAWQAAHLLDDAAPYLSDGFVRLHHAFRSGVLAGVDGSPPRWRRGIALVDALVGDAVGRAYVARTLPPATKPEVEGMVERLRAAFADRLAQVPWLSPATRERARAKLARMGRKVAHPETWRDYAGLRTDPGDLVGSVRAARAFAWDRSVARLARPVERTEWTFLLPQTADAAYSVSLNEIVLPAAELQPPFFDPAADPAVNYGAIGAIIGHEMTHGFDEDGRRFDATGRLADWWSAGETAAFAREADRLAAQLSRTEALPGLFVDGRLTLNEAIADLGGASVALDAFHRALDGRPAPVIDGLTGDQRFFMAFAQAWRWKAREPALRGRIASDPHPPPAVRVNTTVRNMDAWHEAFGVGPGHALYLPPGERVRLW